MLTTMPVSWGAYDPGTLGNGESTLGIAVTPGTSGAEGTATQLLASTPFEAQLVRLTTSAGTVTTVDKTAILDFGTYDGATFRPLIENINVSKQNLRAMRTFTFPLRIPSGAEVRARIQGGSTDTVATRVFMELFGKPNYPHLWRAPAKYETVGNDNTNSRGTVINSNCSTSGAAMPATWTSLGVLAKSAFCLFASMGCSDASDNITLIEYDVAMGDASNKILVLRNQEYTSSSNIEIAQGMNHPLVYGHFPAGVTFYARASCAQATLDSYYNIAVHAGLY